MTSHKVKSRTFGPRRFGEHKIHAQLRKLGEPDLRLGDVLIAKEWKPHNLESFVIPLAQAVVSHHTGASAASEHLLMIVEDGTARNAQAVSGGVLISDGIVKRDHVVYGCTNRRLAEAAAGVAAALGGVDIDETNEDIQRRGESPVKFRSVPGAASVLFRRMNKGKGAQERLTAIYKFVYENKPLGGLRMVCSEFVVTCYEVAAMRMAEIHPDIEPVKAFDVDPRGVSAKALESLLRNPTTPFQLSGRYRGTVPYTKAQWREYLSEQEAAREREREEARAGFRTFDANHVPEAIRRAREARGAT